MPVKLPLNDVGNYMNPKKARGPFISFGPSMDRQSYAQ